MSFACKHQNKNFISIFIHLFPRFDGKKLAFTSAFELLLIGALIFWFVFFLYYNLRWAISKSLIKMWLFVSMEIFGLIMGHLDFIFGEMKAINDDLSW